MLDEAKKISLRGDGVGAWMDSREIFNSVIVVIGFGLTYWMIKRRLDEFAVKLDGKVDEKTCKILHHELVEKIERNDQDHGKFYGWIDDLRLRAARENGAGKGG